MLNSIGQTDQLVKLFLGLPFFEVYFTSIIPPQKFCSDYAILLLENIKYLPVASEFLTPKNGTQHTPNSAEQSGPNSAKPSTVSISKPYSPLL
jgi:hypothetical protein